MFAEAQLARVRLVHDLTTGSDGDGTSVGVTVHDTYPGNVEPPCIVAVPDSPWIEGGSTFGSHIVRMSVSVFVTQRQTDALQALQLLAELVNDNTMDWALSSVDPPFTTTERPDVLGLTLHIAKEV